MLDLEVRPLLDAGQTFHSGISHNDHALSLWDIEVILRCPSALSGEFCRNGAAQMRAGPAKDACVRFSFILQDSLSQFSAAVQDNDAIFRNCLSRRDKRS